ncbi:MAG: hypothetical protein PVSMB4_14040 [Ktedonobacterales bacterium]
MCESVWGAWWPATVWAGRNQSERCSGCIVSPTTASKSSASRPRSTSLCSVALKMAIVRAASYLRR